LRTTAMKARAALFPGAGKPFEIREFALTEAEPGSILVKVTISTICGSDLHTWQGRRKAPVPVILGHEIVGQVAEPGKGVGCDNMGNRLSVGDRITWTIMASCGRCYFCAMKGLPQKCLSLFKYGHESSEKAPHLNGGLAEYIYLRPGTGIFKIPEGLRDEEVAPINCALATVVGGLETIGVERGDNVVIQGAGMLGINAAALLRESGAGKIISLDVDAGRLQVAGRFGADEIIDVSKKTPTEVIGQVRDITGGYGADVVVEVSGCPEVIPQGIEMLRIGGRYALIGTVFPRADFTLDGYSLTTKMITVKGIHNYQSRHLGLALRFVEKTRSKYPFAELITHRFGLEEVEQAFEASKSGEAIRVAVVP